MCFRPTAAILPTTNNSKKVEKKWQDVDLHEKLKENKTTGRKMQAGMEERKSITVKYLRRKA